MAALLFILDALLTLVVVAFLLRLLMPVVRADFRNPIGQAVLQFTNPLVMPLRKVLPPAGRVDVASVLALLAVQLAKTAVLWLMAGGGLALLPLLVAALRDLASRPEERMVSKIRTSLPATPVSMRVIVPPKMRYEYTNRSTDMLGATGILNG